jgi:hypothetical protein
LQRKPLPGLIQDVVFKGSTQVVRVDKMNGLKANSENALCNPGRQCTPSLPLSPSMIAFGVTLIAPKIIREMRPSLKNMTTATTDKNLSAS